MKRMPVVPAVLLALALTGQPAAHARSEAEKPGPAEALQMLKEGNARFVAAAAKNPNSDAERCSLAGRSNQGDFPYATVLSCSDSRVPVERIFDAGVMDLFVIRIAGNVADVDETGSIEYGLAHVNTPVVVVLGHTQCGAVAAVTAAVEASPRKAVEAMAAAAGTNPQHYPPGPSLLGGARCVGARATDRAWRRCSTSTAPPVFSTARSERTGAMRRLSESRLPAPAS